MKCCKTMTAAKGWGFSLLFVLACAAVILPAFQAFATQEPKPLATDRRIRSVVYHPSTVFKFVGHYGYQSSIEFEEGEAIQTISIGDSIAWQLTPIDHRLFLKPIEESADTNMTVVTDRRTYHFELYAQETDDMRDNEMVFVVRFIYPGKMSGGGNLQQMAFEEPLPDIFAEPYRYNFNYSVAGDARRFEPIRIFDDGKFTYFEFAPNTPDYPAFFMVTADGRESLVNFRIRGHYVIVERVASRFTLRHGTEALCVYNDLLAPNPAQTAEE